MESRPRPLTCPALPCTKPRVPLGLAPGRPPQVGLSGRVPAPRPFAMGLGAGRAGAVHSTPGSLPRGAHGCFPACTLDCGNPASTHPRGGTSCVMASTDMHVCPGFLPARPGARPWKAACVMPTRCQELFLGSDAAALRLSRNRWQLLAQALGETPPRSSGDWQRAPLSLPTVLHCPPASCSPTSLVPFRPACSYLPVWQSTAANSSLGTTEPAAWLGPRLPPTGQ